MPRPPACLQRVRTPNLDSIILHIKRNGSNHHYMDLLAALLEFQEVLRSTKCRWLYLLMEILIV